MAELEQLPEAAAPRKKEGKKSAERKKDFMPEELESLSRIVAKYRLLKETALANRRQRRTTRGEARVDVEEIEREIREMIAFKLFDKGGELVDPHSEQVTQLLSGEGLPLLEVAPQKKLSVAEEIGAQYDQRLPIRDEKKRLRWADLELPITANHMIQKLIQQCRYAQYDLFEKLESEGRGNPVAALNSGAFDEVRSTYVNRILDIINRYSPQRKIEKITLLPAAFQKMLLGMEPRPEQDPRRNDVQGSAAAEAVREPKREEEKRPEPKFTVGSWVIRKSNKVPSEGPLRVVRATWIEGTYWYAGVSNNNVIDREIIFTDADAMVTIPDSAANPQRLAEEEIPIESPPEEERDQAEAASYAHQLKSVLDPLWNQATAGIEPTLGINPAEVSEQVYARLEQFCYEHPEDARQLLADAERLNDAPRRLRSLEKEIMERSLRAEVERRQEMSRARREKLQEQREREGAEEARNPWWRGFWKKMGSWLTHKEDEGSSPFVEGMRKLEQFDAETEQLAVTIEQAESLKATVHAARLQILEKFAEQFPGLQAAFEKAKETAQQELKRKIALHAPDETTPEGTPRVSMALLNEEEAELTNAKEYSNALEQKGGLIEYADGFKVREGGRERALSGAELTLHVDYLLSGVVNTELDRAVDRFGKRDDQEYALAELKLLLETLGKRSKKGERFFQNVLRLKMKDEDTSEQTRTLLKRLFDDRKWPLEKEPRV